MTAHRGTRLLGTALVAAGVLVVAGTGYAIARTGHRTPAVTTAAVAFTEASPDAAIAHAVGISARQATFSYWTPARMATATPAGTRSGSSVPASALTASTPKPPPGTPTATHFTGVPTVGALFYTTDTTRHFCTASSINSSTRDIILTAAHCVYGKTYVTNVEYVPEYHNGIEPYGAWPVSNIVVAAGWQKSHNPDLDFAFLAVTPPAGGDQPLESVTGSLGIAVNRGYVHNPLEVIGYNDTDSEAVHCATKSQKYNADYIEFFCHDYWTGTSGGPWIVGYNAKTGGGTVVGNIGGYEGGGDFEWLSYSPYYTETLETLFQQAEKATSKSG
jgi:V8-like Glu-specific endopeptidase